MLVSLSFRIISYRSLAFDLVMNGVFPTYESTFAKSMCAFYFPDFKLLPKTLAIIFTKRPRHPAALFDGRMFLLSGYLLSPCSGKPKIAAGQLSNRMAVPLAKLHRTLDQTGCSTAAIPSEHSKNSFRAELAATGSNAPLSGVGESNRRGRGKCRRRSLLVRHRLLSRSVKGMDLRPNTHCKGGRETIGSRTET